MHVVRVSDLLPSPFLVVGGDGLVGRAVADYFDCAGHSVFVTSRRNNQGSVNCMALDLARCAAFTYQPSTVLLCASITNIALVEKARDDTRKINVDAITGLARNLHANGSHIIYISSVGVFGDSSELMNTATQPFPANVYGQQKVDAERQLLSLGDRVAVVRPTKIVSWSNPIIREWMQRLRMGIEINPLSDFLFCPVSLKFLAHSLAGLALLRPSGVFHLSGQFQISYADFAISLAVSMGVAPSLVVPKHSREFNIPAFYPPRQPCLGMASTTALLGVQPQTCESVIDDLLIELSDRELEVQ